ncbi:MAG TPA: 50S ribosomal protein L11 methyltransferase, partial [Ilumatobacteraceae bacterium]
MVVLTVSPSEAELVSEDLWSLGVTAIEERESATPETIELWTSLGQNVERAFELIRTTRHMGPVRFEVIDRNVMSIWREWAVPSWVDEDLVIVPAWVSATFDTTVTVVSIEPDETFGLGDHGTTVVSARLLRTAMLPGAKVLDVGCGSGVLGILACIFGASQVEATDIFEPAVETTIANARANGCADRIHVTTTPAAELQGPFDVVVCNIYVSVIVDFAADLRRLL